MHRSPDKLEEIKLSRSGAALGESILVFAYLTIFLLVGIFLPDASYLMFFLAGLGAGVYAYCFAIYQAPAHLTDGGIQAGEKSLRWESIERIRFYFGRFWGVCLVTYDKQGSKKRLLFLTAWDEVLSSRILTRWQKVEGGKAVRKEDRILLYGSVIERA